MIAIELIELFVYVSIASMMIVCVNVMNKRGIVKKSDFIYFCVLLSLIISQIIITTALIIRGTSQSTDSIPPISLICIGAILALALIYIVTLILESSTEIREYARTSTEWATYIAFIASFCAILLWGTQIDLYRMPFALALCIGMQYYPSALDRLVKYKGVPEEIIEEEKGTVEKDMEGHKAAAISLVIESWHLAKIFERAITQMNAAESKRYTSQLRWFIKETEKTLEDIGLRIVNVEGSPYDPGMAATPVNIEDFDANDALVVNLMIEPIIMEGKNLVKTGKVTLRRVEL